MKLLLCMDLREEHTEKEEEKRFAFIWILIKKICMKYHTMQQVEKNSAVIQANTLIQT